MANYAGAIRCYQGSYDQSTRTFTAVKELPLCSLRGACYAGDRNTGPVLSDVAAFMFGTGFTLNVDFDAGTGDIQHVRMFDPEGRKRYLRAVDSILGRNLRGELKGATLPYPGHMVKGIIFGENPVNAEDVSYCVVLLSFNSIYKINE